MDKQLDLILKKLKKEILEQFGSETMDIILFGSQARGDADKNSDIDVLVITKNNDWHLGDKIGEVAYNILLETGTYISTKIISQQQYLYLTQIHAPFIDNVIKEGISL